MKLIDLVGRIFGKLTVISEFPYRSNSRRIFLCQCTCGNKSKVPYGSLTGGLTKSCGCGQGRLKHGHTCKGTKSKEWSAWHDMLDRCYNTKSKSYKDYGGRGITVCKKWDNFTEFLTDMGSSPKGSLLDRIDNSKGYTPANCRWATPKQSARNTRRTRYIMYLGERTTIPDLADRYNLPYEKVFRKIHYGTTPEEAIKQLIGD